MHLINNKNTSNFYWPERHTIYLQKALKEIKGKDWSWELPVFILNRCWLRLEKLKVIELKVHLPPDCSDEAPELKKYYNLIDDGLDQLLALQECWEEFGMEDFYRALRHSWNCKASKKNGWNFTEYISLVKRYKNTVAQKKLEVPLIILGRSNEYKHHVDWICEKSINMANL